MEAVIISVFHGEVLVTVNLAVMEDGRNTHSVLLATVNASQYPRQVPA